MTRRPSDEAREALRAARAQAAREPRDHPPSADRPDGQPRRPADVAREALRRAIRTGRGAPPAAGKDTPPDGEAMAAAAHRETPDGAPSPSESSTSSVPPDHDRPLRAGGTAAGQCDNGGDTSPRHGDDNAPRACTGAGSVSHTAAPDGTGTTDGPHARVADPTATSGDAVAEETATAAGQTDRDRPTADDPSSHLVGGRRGPADSRANPYDTTGNEPSGTVPGTRDTGPSATATPGDARTDAAVSRQGPPAPAASGPRADTAPDDAPEGTRRPGDMAREALRSARAERERARASADDSRHGPTGAARRHPASRGARTSPGDRATDERALQVRAALADAFRTPPGTPSSGRRPPGSRDGADPADDPRREPPAGPDLPQPAPAPLSADPVGHHPGTAAGPVRPPTSHPPHAVPRSMADPARDGDLRRTFPAFPPRTPDAEDFAGTWWGRAWITALEGGALDAARLARGRAYAEQGHVDAITVTPGLVLAYVRGSRPRPYRVQVRLRTFEDADWERFLDAAAERTGHIAALLDREMPRSLAGCGVPLLPAPGDLVPRCSCPDSGHPCKHAAALCYRTARLLDADPFVLLLLRGRSERDVIDALSRRSAAREARAAQGKEPEPLPGVRAADAAARRDRLPPLPAPLPPPPHPEQPPVHPASPGAPDPFALDQLATDAAARAHALLGTGRDPAGGLTLWQDAVRLAAARPGVGLTGATRAVYGSLARAVGRTPAELARAVAAWRQGGPDGLAVLEEPWDPPAGRFDRARPLLLAAGLPRFRPWRNHLTHPRGHVQLRLGRDHLWYAYESEPGLDDWWPRGTPAPDPVGALSGLSPPDEGF